MHLILHKGSLRISLADHPTIKPIQLTLSEFLVLKELLTHQGEHLTKHHLLKMGWPNSFVCDNALNMVIMSLRKKLLRLGGWIEINTIYKVGYSLNKTDEICVLQ
ncbi:helix-turn-helix domain-containing protein [Vibrio coralliirubri]|uniref:winged helix-turn-helix domain-containing protein n=1 Tax=Vibrio TaxID=662 RepID=UPI0020BE5A84|nr:MULTISPECIES: helix-turn-helix domain-containing protein [Vibrio]MCK8086002.1 helix-turn-helix domain-containing protein [Vibrio sp. 1CM8B]MCY9863800.1 helix-turn-helix domain-containing protein [Vibrio coralliirubri]